VNADPWQRRPTRPLGDPNPDPIFCGVGLALTLWETIEGGISVAYVGLIYHTEYRSDKYFGNSSFERRHELVRSAIALNVHGKDCTGFGEFIDEVLNYAPRRHEIAHGRVFGLGEYGFYLCPTNVLRRNFPDGAASYQYTSDDIIFYCSEFRRLSEVAAVHATRLGQI
jgi:hypothetical protein